jgi:adenosylmethionine-8-amino-7-oxononanoate aminotransferase
MDSEAIARTAFVPHSVPFALERAEGCYLFTPDGRAILDAGGGAIVTNIGHGRREVAEAVSEAIVGLTYAVPTFATPQKARLVERLVANWLPAGITRCFFTSGGSESVEAAVRLARAHHLASRRPERHKVIGLDLSYHGISLGALGVGYHAPRRAPFEPMLPAFPHAPNPYDNENAAAQLEQLILREGPDTVAAFIAEPVVGSAGGALVPPADYWPRLRELCDRYGMLLIADEVMTGFGRTGKRFAVEHWGVTPDILVGGKGLAGGYAPIGGVFATEAVVAPLAERREDLMFYTFSGHPAACAAADTVLAIMEREQLVERTAEVGTALGDRLRALEAHPNVLEVRGLGLMLGIELVRDRRTGAHFPPDAGAARRVTAEGLRRGAWFYPAGSASHPDCVMLGPPFVIGETEVEVIATTLEASIDAAVDSLAAPRTR